MERESIEGYKDGDSQSLLSNNSPRIVTAQRHSLWSRLWPWLLIHLLILTTFTITIWQTRLQCPKCKEDDMPNDSFYSPVLRDVGRVYHHKQFNGSASIYRGSPSPEIDKAWESLVSIGRISITENELIRLGKPTTAVTLPEEVGGGYLAGIDMFHQLHCLDMLRQNTYRDYYENRGYFGSSPEFIKNHLDHCIDYLRQALMCTGDVGLITWNWVTSWEKPYPDFDTNHQCRDFDSIWNWQKEHELHMSPAADQISKTAGAHVLPTSPIPP